MLRERGCSEKEDEMEIGYPIDVLSHIGWDSSPSSAPSWLHEFKKSNNMLEATSSWPFQGKVFKMNNLYIFWYNFCVGLCQ
ncbi:unnamed protein product [Brassica oleracea]